ncbi:MAG: metallophosphoesterase family protein [Neptuniibacter sp.]
MAKDEQKIIRIAVVSDLHFLQSEEHSSVSWLTFKENGELKDHLWSRLIDKVETDNIKADLLLCPGDITTWANKAGLNKAWESLIELGKSLDVDIVTSATGNHDVSSRKSEIKDNPIRQLDEPDDLIENLKQLSPPYPLVDLKNNDSLIAGQRRVLYFGADYLIFDESENYRLVVFNSCARHTQNPTDYERGRIAESALSWLEDQLKDLHDTKQPKTNIFLCHHHPVLHDELNLGTYDFMHNGTELLSMLGKYGSWMVIHGHKHHARIRYDGKSGIKPIPIFAAGTLAAHKETLGDGFNNQFYIIEINTDSTVFGLKGQIKAWHWAGNRWNKTKNRSDGIAYDTGFGFQDSLQNIIPQIDELVPRANAVAWAKILGDIPELKYMIPSDMEHLKAALEQIDIDMCDDDDGCLVSLSRAVS